MAAKSRTAKFYASHPKSRRHHVEHQAIINRRPSEVKKRVELTKYNRKQTKLGNNRVGDNTDASHKYDKATKKMKIVGYSLEAHNRGDKNNAPGDQRARGKRKK